MAARLSAFEPTTRLSARGGGASAVSSASRSRTARGRSPQIRRSRHSAAASARVPSGPAVGPEPMARRSSPTTSDRISAVTGAGAASRASPPPFSVERCWRTRLTSPMAAPEATSSRPASASSSSVSPGAGAASIAEAPPLRKRSTRVPRPRGPGRRLERPPGPQASLIGHGMPRSDQQGARGLAPLHAPRPLRRRFPSAA